MLFFRKPKPASFAKIRTQILSRWLSKQDAKCPVVAFTSRQKGDGVSTVTKGLARSFSAIDSGRVLLLDASRKHPRKARVLDISDSANLSRPDDFVTEDSKFGFDILRLVNSYNKEMGIQQAASDMEPPEHEAPDDAPQDEEMTAEDENENVFSNWSTDSATKDGKARKLLEALRHN